jgi:hypothetical protein
VSVIHKLISSIWNKEGLLDQWKEFLILKDVIHQQQRCCIFRAEVSSAQVHGAVVSDLVGYPLSVLLWAISGRSWYLRPGQFGNVRRWK